MDERQGDPAVSDTLAGKHLGDPAGPRMPEPPFVDGPEPPRALTASPTSDVESTPPLAGAPAERRQTITCPSCKLASDVALNRRSSTDFCPQCDYPLFWTPESILLNTAEAAADSLRRRPGTDGHDTVGSALCPNPDCREPNAVDALTCRACGGPMVIVRERPAPVVVVPEPEPVEVVEEPAGTPLWVWIVVGLITALALGLIIWAAV